MKKLFALILVLSLALPFQSVAATNTADMYSKDILKMYYGVTEEGLLKEIKEAAQALNKSEEEIAKQIYAELSVQEELRKQEAQEYKLFSPDKGSEGTYTLDASNKGDLFYETASTIGIQHGHIGLYYSTSTLVESVPSAGVRSLSRTNKKVDTGARIQAVHGNYASATDKSNAANWANSRVGVDAYSYNFATNRLTSCIGDKNCSKLVWCAFLERVGIDLDGNGGLGVYPKDIRDSNLVYTIKYY